MTILYLTAILILIPIFLGLFFFRIVGIREQNNKLTYLCGTLLLFSMFEVVGVVSVKQNYSLTKMTSIFISICAVLILAAVFICRKELMLFCSRILCTKKNSYILVALFILLLLSALIFVPYDSKDILKETVGTTVYSDTLYQVNPLTGQEMINGMYPINQICTWPLLMASMVKITQCDIATVTDYAVPIFTIILHLTVVGLWAQKLVKPKLFMIIYCTFLIGAGNIKGQFTFLLLHRGYWGNTILLCVILPFLFYLLYTWKNEKSNNKKPIFYANLISLLAIIGSSLMLANLSILIDELKEIIVGSIGFSILAVLLCGIYCLANNSLSDKSSITKYLAAGIVCIVLGWWIVIAAFILTDTYNKLGSKNERRIGSTLIIIVAVLCGNGVFVQNGLAYRTFNQNTEEQVLEAILEDCDNTPVILAGPNSIMDIARKYNSELLLPYGRDYWTAGINNDIGDIYDDEAYALYANIVYMNDNLSSVENLTEEQNEKMLNLASLAADNSCNYLVTTAQLKSAKWNLLTEIDSYSVYYMIK